MGACLPHPIVEPRWSLMRSAPLTRDTRSCCTSNLPRADESSITLSRWRPQGAAPSAADLGAIVAAPLNLVGAPLNFIINNAIKGFKGGYARIRNFKPKA